MQTALPGFAELDREPTQLINQSTTLIAGSDYARELPSSNVLSSMNSTAIMLQADYEQQGPAFALFQMHSQKTFGDNQPYQPLVTCMIDSETGIEGLCFVIANHASHRWVTFPLEAGSSPGEYQAEFGSWNEHINAYGVMSFGVLSTSGTPFLLEQLQFGTGFRPHIDTRLHQNRPIGPDAQVSITAYVHPDDDPAFGGIANVAFDLDDDGIAESPTSPSNNSEYMLAEKWLIPEPGMYRARIRVEAGSGDVFEQYIETSFLAQMGSIEPTASMELGDSFRMRLGRPVRFDASGSQPGDTAITRYFWFVDDQPLFDSAEPVLIGQFETAGMYTVRLLVVDEKFNISSIEHELAVSADGKTWESTVLPDEPGKQFFLGQRSWRVVDGRPAILWRDSIDGGRLRYMRALDAAGSSWPGQAVDIHGGASSSEPGWLLLGLLESQGKPLAFYVNYLQESAPYTIYMRAGNDADGNSWSEPVSCLTSEFEVNSYSFECRLVDGRPAFVARAQASQVPGWIYCSAMDEAGSSWMPATTLLGITQYPVKHRVRLLDWAGLPCLAWSSGAQGQDKLQFMRAEDSSGNSWSEPLVLFNSFEDVSILDMALVSDRPAVAFVSEHPDQLGRRDRLGYVSCLDDSGLLWSEPSFTASNMSHQAGNLLELDGKPAIVAIGEPYEGLDPYLMISHARPADGTGWQPPMALPSRVRSSLLDSGTDGIRDLAVSVNGVPTVLVDGIESMLTAVYY